MSPDHRDYVEINAKPMSEPGMMQKLTIEAVGTALLCFSVATAAGYTSMAAVAIGSTLMCAVYLGGHVSGAHLNPAVSVACTIRGACAPLDMVLYICAQLVGSAIAGGLAMTLDLSSGIGMPAIAVGAETYSAIIAEAILTFALCHTVLHTATVSTSNSYYGLAIGFTVLSGAVSVGGISGGAFNPAVAFLTVLGGGVSTAAAITYSVGPLTGAVLAGGLFRLTMKTECDGGDNPAFTPYVIEFVGTFMLCYTVSCAAASSNGSPELAGLSIGTILMTQVYAGGPTSGGLYNPAATVGLMIRQKLAGVSDMSPVKTAGYCAIQLVAALAAAAMAVLTLGTSDGRGAPVPPSASSVLAVIVAETVGTFFLVTVILQTATAAKVAGNQFFGLAIGFSVTAMAYAIGGISGGAYNPAVAMLSLGKADAGSFCLVFFSPFLGAILAALLFRFTNDNEFAKGVAIL